MNRVVVADLCDNVADDASAFCVIAMAHSDNDDDTKSKASGRMKVFCERSQTKSTHCKQLLTDTSNKLSVLNFLIHIQTRYLKTLSAFLIGTFRNTFLI